jgi:hypothetical protein
MTKKKRYNPGRRKTGNWGDLGLGPRKDINDIAKPTFYDKKYLSKQPVTKTDEN